MRHCNPLANASAETFTTVEIGQLTLEVADVGLEAVALPPFEGEKVAVFLLGAIDTRENIFCERFWVG